VLKFEASASSKKCSSIPNVKAGLLETAEDATKKNMLCNRSLCMYKWSKSGRKEPKANKARLLRENLSLSRKQIIRAVKT
jgi:hypothetical protein